MAEERQLWVGPFGAALADRALDAVPIEPTGLWIAPSALARDRARRRLILRQGSGATPRVWCWDDLWAEVRGGCADGPARLSAAGTRAVVIEAVDRARRAGRLGVVARVAETPGFRRRLKARFAAWTRAEMDPDGEPPGDPIGAEEWAIFGHYRAILRRLDAADDEAMAAWAAWRLRDDPPPALRRFGYVTPLDPTRLRSANWRALAHLIDRAAAVLVTLPFDPGRPEAFASVATIRDRLIEWKFTETAFEDESARPEGLAAVGRELFRDEPDRIDVGSGVRVIGAPQGDGVARAVAGRVRELLASGAHPDDLLVLVPRLDDDAALIAETIRAWCAPERPFPGFGGGRPGRSEAVAALRLAAGLPVEDFEAARLIRLVRNGEVRPAWWESIPPSARAIAADAIRRTRVFRGRDALREALRRAAGAPASDHDDQRRQLHASRAATALEVLGPLIDAFRRLERPAPWSAQVARLEALAAELGLAMADPGLDDLFAALDDHGAVLGGLGLGERPWTWPQFVREVEASARGIPDGRHAPEDGSMAPGPSVTTVEAAEGARARHVILANLAEGTFPAREAIGGDLDETDDDRPDLRYPREQLRFLGVVAAAEDSLTLVWPTADEAGEDLLPAGFLDDVRRLFEPDIRAAIETASARLDPIPRAGSAAEVRVGAVAQALLEPGADVEELRSLARSPIHRTVLDGAADALEVAHARTRPRGFGPHDGRLADPRAARKIADDFGPDRPAFSPSQLESLAYCPFQFYQRYVLRLEPIDDRDELDDDRAARGSLIHRALESLHLLLRDGDPDSGPLADRFEAIILQLLESEGLPRSALAEGVRAIERSRMIEDGRRYERQLDRYRAKEGAGAVWHRFELSFGKPDDEQPALVLGGEADAVRLQGKIDRVDLVEASGQRLFRVIDYKSGYAPNGADVASGLALQLPLYAMAVERMGLADRPIDVGYWSLKGKGYGSVKVLAKVAEGEVVDKEDWLAYRRALEGYVLGLVGALRRAAFPVRPHPRAADCARSCDFHQACRIRQVRSSRKVWAEAPRMAPAEEVGDE